MGKNLPRVLTQQIRHSASSESVGGGAGAAVTAGGKGVRGERMRAKWKRASENALVLPMKTC